MTYLAYAGIGSRDTPENILKVMHNIGAYLFSEGWTLRSGAADGADKAFEDGYDSHLEHMKSTAGKDGIVDLDNGGKEIYLPWKGFNNSQSPLHPGNLPFSAEYEALAASMHPAWHRCSPAARKMHTRNVCQILGHEQLHGPVVQMVKFVVCWTPGGAMKGGTSQALRIANSCGVRVMNLGLANSPEQLEEMLLEIDRVQNQEKAKASTNDQGHHTQP